MSLKEKLEKIKVKAKKNAPALISISTTVMGTAGWIVAGAMAQRVRKLEEIQAQNELYMATMNEELSVLNGLVGLKDLKR